MESVMENMLNFMQGMHLTGQASLRTPDFVDRFQRLNPPIFRGKAGADLSESKYWIEQIEKIFNFIGCGEGEKVGCATFMLQDEADQWWKTMQRTLQGSRRQGTPIVTWAQFKELYYAKYFPLCKKMEKAREFMDLKQTGDMYVTQYEDHFTRLIKYMPIYNLDEEAKAQKFLGGMKLEIQLALNSLGTCTYAEVVSQALIVERNLHRMNSLRTEIQEPKDRKLGKKHDLRVRKENFKNRENCPRCQKFHPRKPCERRNPRCYTCGGKDHISRDCSKGPMCFNRR
ncbi:uncharacterized protein LOC127799759 [Diospyros lotus]|uniref:uncharacterized protein LOC127799759 n=1 Tax=Diospyros lotus TaxID=55363 RepID=UPI00224E32BA|nr:uncharacterized protein LOC127799759 [Diospyros lotus]